MAEIFRAKARGLGGFEKVLAIKRLHRHFEEGDEFAQMLIDEAKIAVHLTHPNIAQIFDLGRIDSRYFIAMEYIDGTDMHRAERALRERGRKIPVPVALFALSEALSGLHYAHTRCDSNGRPMEIVHRDVSPQNIMISRAGEVKIVDFGIAKAEKRLQEETQQGIIKGKFYYMAPEQAYGHHVDARTDIFAAGMCLYEFLAGANPYEGLSDHELLHAVRQAQIDPISAVRRDIDQQLERIVMTAIRRDPQYRFKNAREFQRVLSDYISNRYGSFRRLDMGEFVQGLPPAAFGNTAGPDEVTDRLSREEYEASEESVIFEPGSPFDDQRDERFDPGPDSDINPFAEDEATELWMPGDRKEREDPFDGLPTPPPDENRFGGSPEPEPEPQFRRDVADPVHLGDASAAAGPPGKERTDSVDVGWLDGLTIRKRYIIGAAALFTILLSVGIGVAIVGGDDGEGSSDIETISASSDKTSVAEPSEEQPEFVDLEVTSVPSGAEVLVEGVSQGETPMTLTDLIPNESYKITFEKDGFRNITRQINVTSDPKPVEVTLRSSKGDGILKVTTFPTNASVFLDGEEVGKSPVTIDGLQRKGEYEVSAELTGRESVEQTIDWSDDKRVKRLSLEFPDDSEEVGDDDERVRRRPKRRTRRTPSRSTGSPSKSSADDSKEGLDLWGDGESSEESSSGTTASKSEDDSGKLNIWGDDSSKSQQKSRGFLSVQVQRGWGKVFVNGRLVARETPLVKHSIETGTHRVKVYYPTLKRYSKVRRVRVQPGKTSTEIFSP
ncbi:MAG: protein kinase domain-containing protein [Myxococcota bacterium]